ncbi:MAG: LysE family translocator, partial [Actinobacteria bacterium]|nr:LysE family translocator [Actinomycetota bacterium]
MVIPSRFGEYVIAAFVIILAPGPSVLFVIARAIAWGRKIAVLTVAGNVTGFFTISLIISIGLGPLLQKSDLAYAAIQWGGGAYLIYLGIDAIRHRKVHAGEMTNQGDVAPSVMRSVRDGFWVGFLNPKALVFNAAVLP